MKARGGSEGSAGCRIIKLHAEMTGKHYLFGKQGSPQLHGVLHRMHHPARCAALRNGGAVQYGQRQ